MNYPELERCIEIVKTLRHPKEGCPWDLKQNHQSLLKYLIEESYEFVEAVEKLDSYAMEEEIGDVLFQVLLHTTIAEETGAFSLESAAKYLADKLIKRHPHVFKEKNIKLTPEQVLKQWQEIKKEEKGEQIYSMEEKLLHAPSLEASFNIGKKSTSLNFDWSHHSEVLDKVEEELDELKVEIQAKNQAPQKIKEEIGDLLFSVAQLARHLNLNPEECLREANKKFIGRFQKVEDLVKADNKLITTTPQHELETYWKKVKEL